MQQPYYQEDGITIYHGDCRDVLPSVSGFDAVVTDPPWNMTFFDEVARKSAALQAKRTRAGIGATGDGEQWEAYREWIKPIVGALSHRCDGQVWFLSTKCLPYVADLFVGYQAFAAVKTFSQMTPKRLPNCWDVAFVRDNEQKYMGNGRNWFVCNTAGMMTQRTSHPTPRSEDVMRYVVGMFDWKTVLDPFAGSGTTLLAAKLEARQAVGIEIEERYCEIAANRLRQKVLPFKLGQNPNTL
jgi:site-specific DNA-methyltransferase (adenine-specific)